MATEPPCRANGFYRSAGAAPSPPSGATRSVARSEPRQRGASERCGVGCAKMAYRSLCLRNERQDALSRERKAARARYQTHRTPRETDESSLLSPLFGPLFLVRGYLIFRVGLFAKGVGDSLSDRRSGLSDEWLRPHSGPSVRRSGICRHCRSCLHWGGITLPMASGEGREYGEVEQMAGARGGVA